MTTTVNEGAKTAISAPSTRWVVLAILGVAQSMLIVDLTVLNVALPSIAADLRLDRAALTWVATIYTLFFGSLLLLGGRLADAVGRRRMVLTGLGVFTAASLASGLAPDGLTLVLSRIAQGVGAAMLSPAALSIITTTFSGHERAKALGVWAALSGAGAVAGVILGGLLTAGPGWPWVFFLNVPIGLAVGAAVFRIVPADPHAKTAGGLDLPGAIASTATLGLLLYGLITAGDAGWTSTSTLTPIGAAAIAGFAFVLIERRAVSPLVRLDIVRRPRLGGALSVLLVFAALLGGVVFLGSLYTQRLLGMTPLESGLTFLPFAIAIVVGAQGGAHGVARLGPRRTAMIGLGLAAVGTALLARIPANGEVLVDLLPGLVLVAAGLGATAVSANTSAFVDEADADAGVTSGLVNTSHELGFAVGVTALSTVAGASLASDPTVVAGYQAAFLAAAIVAAVFALVAWLALPSEAPASEGHAFGH